MSISDKIVCVDGGDSFSASLGATGRLYLFGTGFHGELGDGNGGSTKAETPTALPLFLDGQIAVCGVACGHMHVIAATSGGGCFSWGSNAHGQLGRETADASSAPIPAPVPLLAQQQLAAVAAGSTHSLALAGSGEVLWSWGAGEYGQLGLGEQKSAVQPTSLQLSLTGEGVAAVPSKQQVTAIAAGWGHSAAVASDGSLFTFGWGLYSPHVPVVYCPPDPC